MSNDSPDPLPAFPRKAAKPETPDLELGQDPFLFQKGLQVFFNDLHDCWKQFCWEYPHKSHQGSCQVS